MKSKKRAAIYARVSTDEGRQTPETQLRELREYAERRGFDLVGEYVDHASGRTNDRTDYKRLLSDARARKLDVVLVWRYDRFARSVQALINALTEFRAIGVDFVSHQEQIDITIPQGELILGIMATLAQFESRLIGERVKTGMARAKAEGRHVARPPLSLELQENEPPRFSRRLRDLRGSSDGKTSTVLTRSAGAGGQDGLRPGGAPPLAVVSDAVDRLEDRLYGRDASQVGQAGRM